MATEVKRLLVCGATGKQGGAVVQALLDRPPPFKHEILALTRKRTTPAAKSLASHPQVRLVQGDLDNVSAIFETCGGINSVYGVFLVTLPSMKRIQEGIVDKEVVQGRSMIEEAVKNNVQHFVFSSVDRGGDKSFDNPTPIPHFITKHELECYLRDSASGTAMTWTILRPVAFMDNLTPNLPGRIFATAWAQMGPQKLQLVAVKDIGIFAALAFAQPNHQSYKNKAVGLAGAELSQSEGSEHFWAALHRPMIKSYGLVASLVKYMVPDLGIMFDWFKTDGYGVDIEYCKQLNPTMLTFKDWLQQESDFVP